MNFHSGSTGTTTCTLKPVDLVNVVDGSLSALETGSNQIRNDNTFQSSKIKAKKIENAFNCLRNSFNISKQLETFAFLVTLWLLSFPS